ncbi:MAG: hypothetical protein WBJ81_00260 [Rickettsiales bacterium]
MSFKKQSSQTNLRGLSNEISESNANAEEGNLICTGNDWLGDVCDYFL